MITSMPRVAIATTSSHKTAEGAASAVCTHAMAIKHPKTRFAPMSSIHDKSDW